MAWTDPTPWAWIFFLSEWAIRLAMMVVVPFRRTPAAAKGWLLLIFFEPWVGLLLYLLIGRAKLPRWRRRRLAKLPQVMAKVVGRLTNHPHVFHPEVGPALSQAVTLAENLGQSPILGGNAVELLDDYDGTIDRLVADIDRATNHVHLLFYIFADDRATAPVIEALGRAVQRGVCCRVLADSLGSRSSLRTLRPKLTALGVGVHDMLPVSLLPWKKARVDLRNHRKIAVIDGRIGYTGSQNLVAAGFKEGITYEDLMVRVTGPVVLELQYVFAADWFLETYEVLDCETEFPGPEIVAPSPHRCCRAGRHFLPRTTSGSSSPWSTGPASRWSSRRPISSRMSPCCRPCKRPCSAGSMFTWWCPRREISLSFHWPRNLIMRSCWKPVSGSTFIRKTSSTPST